jgi:DNA-binding NarL/FixJ family response regulator
MTSRPERYDLGPLADFMAEDILSTPGRQLVNEVIEDCGDPEALASAFDKIVHAELPNRVDSLAGLSIAPGQQRTGRKTLVVDGHALIRSAIRDVLKKVKGDATVLEASSCSQAMQLIGEHPDVDLILLDLNLPDRDGFSVLTELGERYPALPVVVLSAQLDRGNVARALDLGAVGFIPKSGQHEVMVSALELVFAGGTYIPPEILARDQPSAQQPEEKQRTANRRSVSPDKPSGVVLRQLTEEERTARAHALAKSKVNEAEERQLAEDAGRKRAEKEAAERDAAEARKREEEERYLGLTDRQLDVLALMVQGKSTKAISRVLNLAEPTVKNHVTAILKALDVSNRTEAVIAVGDLGWKLPPVSQS